VNIISAMWLISVNTRILLNFINFCYNKSELIGHSKIYRANGHFPIALAIRGWFMSRGYGLTILGVFGLAGGSCP
jgi:hypothetical protein